MNNTETLDRYLTGYCQKHKIDAETAKTHSIVKSVAEYYEHVNDGKISVTETKEFGCGGANLGGDCK